MTKFLPTYQDCMDICEQVKIAVKREGEENPKEMFVFAPNTHEVDGTIITTFNYGLFVNFESCKNPIKSDHRIEAFELRGITFVPTEEGYERVLMLPKFFNLNQVEETQFHVLKDIPVKRVQLKEDGSMLGFVRMNDKLYARTKNSFISPQTVLAMSFLGSNNNYELFIHECFDNGLTPIFEMCGPRNYIVVPYKEEILSLLHIRDLSTGEFVDIYASDLVRKYSIKTTTKFDPLPLDHWVELAKTLTGTEGWVVTLEDDTMVKIKTEWYMSLHHLVTEVVDRENLVIKSILDGTIDDITSRLEKDNPRLHFINEITLAVLGEVDYLVRTASKIAEEFSGDRKAFFMKYKEHPLKFFIMAFLPYECKETGQTLHLTEEERVEKVVKNILKRTRHLQEAREYLESLGVDVYKFRSGIHG
jgi:RNA ligase